MDCPWFHGMSMAFCAKLPWTFSSYFPPLFCQIYPGQGVQILQAFSMDTFSMDFHGISIEFHGSFTAGGISNNNRYLSDVAGNIE